MKVTKLNKKFPFELVDQKPKSKSHPEYLLMWTFFAGYVFAAVSFLFLLVYLNHREPAISPIWEDLSPTPTATISATIREKTTYLQWTGKASYYSREGCLGCSKTLTMANGETLDDGRLTLAMTPEDVRKYKLLNTSVTVQNVKTKAQVVAKVTDTGGFSRYRRIADLSVATKQAIGCADLCDVEITAE
jgi:hypothetical protein